MTDLIALRAVHEYAGAVMTTAELAAALDVLEDEAAARISALTKDGYISLPMQVRSGRRVNRDRRRAHGPDGPRTWWGSSSARCLRCSTSAVGAHSSTAH